ncbi:MAG: 16S rRNA processing protein RimM [Sulfurimonas sp.]|nr:16S rRNA processing protein RimM [Sulfurimonas sp.]
MSSQTKEPRLHIATIGKTVGIKGEMKFHIKCDFPEQFQNNSTFLTNKNTTITLSEVDQDKGHIKIAGVFSVEDAKKYTNLKLYTTREETRKNCHLDEGEFFWFDIEDCEICEDTKVLGKVDDVDRIGTTNYLNIITSDELVKLGLANKFLIPFHKPFILKTDIDNKIITTSGALDILEAS